MSEHAELELAQRYAARSVDARAAAAFEEHLLVCTRCQTEVRLCIGLRQALRDAPQPRTRTRQMLGIGAAALAATIAAVLILPSRVDRDISALGAFRDPPPYAGMTVRARSHQGDSLFDAAMTHYVGHRYEAAAAGLTAALAAGVDTIPAEFFRASARLMAGGPRDAVAGYQRIITAGSRAAPYLAEAHLYRARALLRLGRVNEALGDLAAVDRGDQAIHSVAASLADSVRRVIRR